jgi:Lrp/AsnC family leucine-responsive transcriptional regulator
MVLDPIDYKILDLLQRDARTTQVQIAEAVRLSQPSVADRIRKLDASGVVLGYVARLDPRLTGNDIRAFVGVRVSHPRHHDAFTRRIEQIADVLECHRVAGLDSYLISGTLRRIPGVTRTTTTIVLATVKETTVVPLQQALAAPRRRKEAVP